MNGDNVFVDCLLCQLDIVGMTTIKKKQHDTKEIEKGQKTKSVTLCLAIFLIRKLYSYRKMESGERIQAIERNFLRIFSICICIDRLNKWESHIAINR